MILGGTDCVIRFHNRHHIIRLLQVKSSHVMLCTTDNYTVLSCITSYHITSHHITSHHITSYHIMTHHISSHHISSHLISSHLITSHHMTSHHITSYHIISHHDTSYQFLLSESTSFYSHNLRNYTSNSRSQHAALYCCRHVFRL